jgi:hypothetical protein
LVHRFICIVLALVICASTSEIRAIAGSFPSDDITAGELIPLASWQKQFIITEGKDRGKVVPLMLHHVAANQERWKLIFGNYGGILLVGDPGGALAMERLDLFKSRSYIVYEPALPILPRGITSGASIVRQASFRMHDLETGKLKRSGRATHLVKQISHSHFPTPAGLIDGYYVDIEHWMEMPYAQLHLTLGLGFRLDDGPVYGASQYTLKKLGLFSATKLVTAALTNR